MTRAEAIAILKHTIVLPGRTNGKTAYAEALQMAIKALEEPQWTPCSEFTGDGYPEEDGLYFVTEQNYGFYLDGDVKQKVAHTCWFKDHNFVGRVYNQNYSNIVAWMPLPKTWEGEKHE